MLCGQNDRAFVTNFEGEIFSRENWPIYWNIRIVLYFVAWSVYCGLHYKTSTLWRCKKKAMDNVNCLKTLGLLFLGQAKNKIKKIAQYMELQQLLQWGILYWPRMGLCCLYLQGFQMEKTGELAMWGKQPKSNWLLKSKIKILAPKHNLPAG